MIRQTLYRLLVGLFLATGFSSCFTANPVEFRKIDKLEITRENNSPSISFDLLISNPNNWGLHVTQVESDLLLDQGLVGKASLVRSIRVGHHADAALPFSIRTDMNDLLKFLPSGLNVLLGNQRMTAVLRGNITVRKFIFRKKIPFELKENVAAESLRGIF